MSIRRRLKAVVERFPSPVGQVMAAIPFELRLGAAYSEAKRTARALDGVAVEELRVWTLARLKTVVEHAYGNNLFYRTLYDRHSFHPDRLKTVEHFQDVPVVTKSSLKEFELEHRSAKGAGRLLTNTGGTSGEPLTFYLDSQAFAREWAHMHIIWGRAGYDYRDLKLTMRGRNLGKRLLQYNAVHNEWIVNTYADRRSVAEAIASLLKRKEVRWIHGYPSIVAEMAKELAAIEPAVMESLRRRIKGVLLGSEFPADHYLRSIKAHLGVQPTSWYGHSEMCILAFDKGKNNYVPMHGYGYVEAPDEGAGESRLIGTSLWNLASHFIRYDTGDRVAATSENGVVRSFSMTSGRVGESIVDQRGARIPLTALIFGRHHTAFGRVQHVQVRQRAPGSIELLLVPDDKAIPLSELMKGFDFSDVALDVTAIVLDVPVRTSGGKLPLLVS